MRDNVSHVKDGIIYFKLTEREKQEIAENEALRALSDAITAHIQSPEFPLTKEWVQDVWSKIEEYAERGIGGCSNEYQIDMAKLVLDALSNGQCVDPSGCAKIVKDFVCYPW